MNGDQSILPGLFGDGLDPNNRWLRLSREIPWDVIEDRYRSLFDRSRGGARPISARMAFGSLLVQQRLLLTDVETVALIQENPYVQAFLGYSSFSSQRPFDPSLLTHFRKRFRLSDLQDINELIVAGHADSSANDDDDPPGSDDGSMSNADADEHAANDKDPTSGTLMMDATCAPADIAYPTDLQLLSHAREITERIIDDLHAPHRGVHAKPRTYRKKARQRYLQVAKSKKVGRAKARKACRQQLRYVRRNLRSIDQRVEQGDWQLSDLSARWRERLATVRTVVMQQALINEQGERSVPQRIVSIDQPHVRPMVRGKAGTPVEFGAKIAVAHDDGFAFLENISWEPYNECADLQHHTERYKDRHGHYPSRILADKIYRTRANRNWCNERGIRLAGLGPGRPKKDHAARRAIEHEARQDEADRQPMEGIFGRSKRRFGLKRLMTRLPNTSANAIALLMIVLNLERILCALCSGAYFWLITVMEILRGYQKAGTRSVVQ